MWAINSVELFLKHNLLRKRDARKALAEIRLTNDPQEITQVISKLKIKIQIRRPRTMKYLEAQAKEFWAGVK